MDRNSLSKTIRTVVNDFFSQWYEPKFKKHLRNISGSN